MVPFPQPIKLNGSTRFPPTAIHEWEASHGLDLPPLTGMVNVKQLAARYGVSVATIWRWAQKARKDAAA
ncbi:uncharacterized protein FOKN1_1910 [Thiohalobacter thiocyanaticus]|uniref:Transposase n=1 Tax=Thiohalobacter thiocyanaticus TaxID=585455 RepID=A0A1Z4VS96_9GAMM|nr:hypothetical protein [Thiohalobacter thiocyanaticus]BAZ94292.1 uncharacterized protein FOKN1_1910 [Thiohalobacter thiocyanaticus]